MGKKDKFPNCWICKDQGMVFFNKKINEIDYEYATRCKCKLKDESSDKIGIIDSSLADRLIDENFNNFKKIYPDLVTDLVG